LLCGTMRLHRGGSVNDAERSLYKSATFSPTDDVCCKMAQAYDTHESELSVSDVRDILANVDTSRISTRPAQKPQGGEVFVYNYGDAITKGNNYVMCMN